jgi:hypothetical protein
MTQQSIPSGIWESLSEEGKQQSPSAILSGRVIVARQHGVSAELPDRPEPASAQAS